MSDDDLTGQGSTGDFDDNDGEQTLVTKEGLKNLKAELDDLKNVKRKQVAERLKEAISYGDLSENSEYEESKNEQAFIEGRIIELEMKIKNAKIISSKQDSSKLIQIGSSVQTKSKQDSETETYQIVGSTEADPFEKKISNECPVGKALIGQKKGDVVEVNTPSGKQKYEILKVS